MRRGLVERRERTKGARPTSQFPHQRQRTKGLCEKERNDNSDYRVKVTGVAEYSKGRRAEDEAKKTDARLEAPRHTNHSYPIPTQLKPEGEEGEGMG